MEPRHIDLAYLERFCKGDRSRMERYVSMYLEASPALFAKLVELTGSDDAEGIAVVAHSLRPQVNYMGAQGLFDLLTSIEQRARAEGPAACVELLLLIPPLCEQVNAELRTARAALH